VTLSKRLWWSILAAFFFIGTDRVKWFVYRGKVDLLPITRTTFQLLIFAAILGFGVALFWTDKNISTKNRIINTILYVMLTSFIVRILIFSIIAFSVLILGYTYT
jgi:hypothetical protein